MNERRLRNRVIHIATFSPLCQDMDNPFTPSSPLQPVQTEDRDDRLARVEQALSLLADRLAVLTTTSPCLMWACDITVTGAVNQSNVINICRYYCPILTP
jgi:hypothetical protein